MRFTRLLVGMVLLVTACQHFDRARECRALADCVNPELKELATTLGNRSPTTAVQYRDASKKYTAAASRTGNQRFKDPELARVAEELRDNLIAIARSCDRLASRFEHPEQPADVTALRDLEAVRQRHVALVGTVNKICEQQQ
jgi:hypothetical protein